MPRATLLLLLGLGAASCLPAAAESRTPSAPPASSSLVASASEEALEASTMTGSPQPPAEPLAELAPLLELCDAGDAALTRVAERLARQPLAANWRSAEVSFLLRAEGAPYVRPAAWRLVGKELGVSEAAERMREWLAGVHAVGACRCGVARMKEGDRDVLAVVAVDAVADLAPLRMRARSGEWLDVHARMLVPATDAKLIVLGPSGVPYSVPTSFDGEAIRGRFRADRPGPFLVQVLASVAGGPLPVLEAIVYSDVPPARSFVDTPVPGEAGVGGATDPGRALFEMMNQARATEQSPPLVRDAGLDAIAQGHAEAMRSLQRVAHDAGNGDPSSRVQAAGLDAVAPGENVAHAADVARAHRVLWESPSHRRNLLDTRFGKVGIGVAVDGDGSVWVCELFTDTGRASR